MLPNQVRFVLPNTQQEAKMLRHQVCSKKRVYSKGSQVRRQEYNSEARGSCGICNEETGGLRCGEHGKR